MSRISSLLRWTVAAVLLLAPLAMIAGCKKSASRQKSGTQADGADVQVKPNQELSPVDVVRIQIECLSNPPNETDGLRTAFGFSSPRHRIVTGSLSEYVELMGAPQYRTLRENIAVDFFEPEINGDQAQQIVALTDENGEVSFYLFVLSRQLSGDYQGCWMTQYRVRCTSISPN